MKSHFHKVVVVGASRGVGAAVAEHIMPRTTELITVSRSTCIKEIHFPAMSAIAIR